MSTLKDIKQLDAKLKLLNVEYLTLVKRVKLAYHCADDYFQQAEKMKHAILLAEKELESKKFEREKLTITEKLIERIDYFRKAVK